MCTGSFEKYTHVLIWMTTFTIPNFPKIASCVDSTVQYSEEYFKNKDTYQTYRTYNNTNRTFAREQKHYSIADLTNN